MAKDAVSSSPAAVEAPQRLPRPRLQVDPCPTNAAHAHRRIYRTDGRTRYCVCDDCGTRYKMTADEADPLRAYVTELIKSLRAAKAVEQGTQKVVQIVDPLRTEIADTLEALL
jgi:hypothetical protein